ncbi:universal stress protein [Serpentinicella sp. ANB-PHB4]|uniref:universal stress protein n=1 Tax=Serpentinicella sp. ANB-PHB4 TaxID=3074076 RepID=UPI002856D1C2|nr:universal stress protein [Serpentinicella sp. ANB-PHB4]MDR5659980.1 universal stress protein [Serpentinicella sp. ANB-PHB4]
MKKILIPIDGSNYTRKALLQAKEIAKAFQADVEIMTVVLDMRGMYYYEGAYFIGDALAAEDYKTSGEKVIKIGKDVFSDYFAGKVKTTIRLGDAAKEIIDYVENNDFDLIVMGSKGLTGISKLVVGSVSNKVLNNVEVPVLIVK